MDQQVLEVLQATLSPQQHVREQAEQNLKELFLVPEGGLSLARILLAQDVEISQRQSAGVLLQKYIAEHWYLAAEAFQEPVTPLEVKAQIRPIVLHGLSDPVRKIRSAAAFALSTIAKYDWPDEYPDLLTQLVALLQSGSSDSVHGSMQVVGEFVKNDLSEDQLLPVVRDLVPALYAILLDSQKNSASTRARTVETFRSVLHMLATVKDEHPQAVKQALDQLGPPWFEAFRRILGVDAAEDLRESWETLLVRREVYRTLILSLNSFPRLLAPSFPAYLHLSASLLTSLLPIYTSHYLSTDPDAPEPPSPTSDVGSQQAGIDDLACEVFDFLTPAVRQLPAKPALVDEQSGRASDLALGLLESVVDWTRITSENEETWMEDMNGFVMDDDEEQALYSLRTCAHDFVGSLIDKYQDAVGPLLYPLAQRKIQQSAELHQAGDPDWWKPTESVLAMLGGISDDIASILDRDTELNRQTTFDVPAIFEQVVPAALAQTETPFLQGRAFVFASQFAEMLPRPAAERYFAAAVESLESERTAVPVKLSAVKCIKNFCRHLPVEVLHPQAAKILHLLLPLLPIATDETLYLLLETLRAVLALDKDLLTPTSAPELAERVYEIWLKFSTDPVLTAIVEELFESLTLSPPPVLSALITRIAPRISAAIATPITDETVHLPAEAVQLANALIRSRGGPIERELVATITAAVLACLAATDDMDVIQHGMIHLTLLVRKDCEKLVEWHDAQGSNGISAIFNLLARFLSPTFSESGGIFVGELVMHLFRKAGSAIGPILPDLLRALVDRIANAQLPIFVQSLVLPFAYLFGTEHTIETLDLLSSFSVTTADGSKTGLEVVLASWCETCETITGSWNIRVSDLGMSKLFAMPDERLRHVEVKGDLVISEVNRDTIMTRSRTKINPNHYTRVAFPVKAFKLLLKDLQQIGGGKKGAKGADMVGIEEDDGDDEWDDDDPLGGTDPVDEFGYLSDWLDGGAGGENDAQDDDEDLRADPLAQIDMAQHLTDVLRQCYATNGNGMHEMIEGLTEGEKGILRGVLTV